LDDKSDADELVSDLEKGAFFSNKNAKLNSTKVQLIPVLKKGSAK